MAEQLGCGTVRPASAAGPAPGWLADRTAADLREWDLQGEH